ncbi:MAG: hypothetical protein H6587_07120 [Flavobacteriales bacterium]|nr:hypothetical protein [Flavobacteriales bacterium]
MRILFIIVFFTIYNSCIAQYGYIKEEYSIYLERTENYRKSIFKREKLKIGFEKYWNGNVVEKGVYGERWGETIITKDSSVMNVCGQDNGKIYYTDFLIYDETNKLISEKRIYYKNNLPDKLQRYILYSYNEFNKLDYEAWYDKDSLIYHFEKNIYNEEGILIDKVDTLGNSLNLYPDGSLKTSVTYDSLNRVIEFIKFYKGKQTYREEYIYDFDRKTTLHYNENNKLESVEEFEGYRYKPKWRIYLKINSYFTKTEYKGSFFRTRKEKHFYNDELDHIIKYKYKKYKKKD